MNYFEIVGSRYPEELVGDISRADCLVVNSFGTEQSKGSVNANLAEYVIKFADGRPIVADTMVAQLLPQVDFEVTGQISTNYGGGVGTWGIELAARDYMQKYDLRTALQVAQAYHMGRVCMQAVRAGILNNIVPPKEDMPDHFDTASGQVWTRNRSLWVVREALGAPVLKAQGKL